MSGFYFMTQVEKSAEKINKKLQQWSLEQSRLIVAIDGCAGSGKTTIADFIAKQNKEVTVIHLDDFIKHWQDRKEMIEIAPDKTAVFRKNWYRYYDLINILQLFKNKQLEVAKFYPYDYDKNDFGAIKILELNKKILIVEGVFLFQPEVEINSYWDKTIYLDIDLSKATDRVIDREKKKWGKDYLPLNHPDNWFKYYEEAYLQYLKDCRPQEKCDFVLKL